LIDVEVHFQHIGTQRHKTPALPRLGDFIKYDSGLWIVDAIVHKQDAVKLFVIQVSEQRASELQTAWATWNEPIKSE
jgi:hypothetical protein